MIREAFLQNYDGSTSVTMAARQSGLVADSAGVKWALFDIDGWNNGLDVRAAVYQRPMQDGAILDDFSYAPRTIDLRGGFVAPDDVTAVQAVRRLMGSVEVRGYTYGSGLRRLFVNEIAPATIDGAGFTIDFRRSGVPTIKPYANGLAYEFSIPLLCPDGRKLSFTQFHNTQANVIATPLTVVSQGNTPTWADNLLLTGPITNPIITHNLTGWQLKFNGALGAGASAGINTKLHTVGGSFVRSNVDYTSRWLPILPGTNTYTVTGTGTTTATQLECYWHDAWQ